MMRELQKNLHCFGAVADVTGVLLSLWFTLTMGVRRCEKRDKKFTFQSSV
jgi:hypothetical protein